jgi:hypothetical protein
MRSNDVQAKRREDVRVPSGPEIRAFGFARGHAPAVTGGRYLDVPVVMDDSGTDVAAEELDESFTACLRRFVRRSGRSLTAIARAAWLDVAYISRLVNFYSDPRNERVGTSWRRLQPKRDAVIRIGIALELPIDELDELLLSAGYVPLYRER